MPCVININNWKIACITSTNLVRDSGSLVLRVNGFNYDFIFSTPTDEIRQKVIDFFISLMVRNPDEVIFLDEECGKNPLKFIESYEKKNQ